MNSGTCSIFLQQRSRRMPYLFEKYLLHSRISLHRDGSEDGSNPALIRFSEFIYFWSFFIQE